MLVAPGEITMQIPLILRVLFNSFNLIEVIEHIDQPNLMHRYKSLDFAKASSRNTYVSY